MDQNTTNQQQRREARRKRRVRNQILAYITLILFLAVLAGGIVFGVNFLTKQSRQNEQEKQEQVDQMLSTEESLTAPETESATEETVQELTPEQNSALRGLF